MCIDHFSKTLASAHKDIGMYLQFCWLALTAITGPLQFLKVDNLHQVPLNLDMEEYTYIYEEGAPMQLIEVDHM